MAKPKQAPTPEMALEAGLRKILGDASPFAPVQHWMPTGIDLLDMATGGGIPAGRAVMAFGKRSTAKSSLALSIGVQVQRRGGMVYYFDIEQGLSFELAVKIGIDPQRFCLERPAWMEQCMDAIELTATKRAKAKEPTLIVWDCIAGGIPKANGMSEREAQEVPTPGLRAKRLTEFFGRGTLRAIIDSQVYLVLINQTRAVIGAPAYMKDHVTFQPGGEALQFFSGLQIEMKSGESILQGKKPIGTFIEARVKKNKFGPPERRAEFPFFYGYGIDNELSLIYYLAAVGAIPKTENGMVQFGGRYQSKNKLRDAAREDENVLHELREMARVQMGCEANYGRGGDEE